MNIREAIIFLVKSEPAFDVGIATLLDVFRLENDEYAVSTHKFEKGHIVPDQQFEYKTAEEAVDKFLELRTAMQLGFDFEKESP